jgi:hypothetical protein
MVRTLIVKNRGLKCRSNSSFCDNMLQTDLLRTRTGLHVIRTLLSQFHIFLFCNCCVNEIATLLKFHYKEFILELQVSYGPVKWIYEQILGILKPGQISLRPMR